MEKIDTIIFDLGGVIIKLNQPEAVRRFESLGLKNAAQMLDPYCQEGIFGELEEGRISAETFRMELSKMVGRELTFEECRYGWLGYAEELPQRNLYILRQLRSEGYRLVLLSNTNPYMMSWAMSPAFSQGPQAANEPHPQGKAISEFFDACYLSYQMKLMKPDETFFRKVLMSEGKAPCSCLFIDDGPRNVAAASQVGMRTYCPENGEDWTETIRKYL